ncbi:MAG: glycoside hydrolase family 16 protein [Chitinophagaceae bacterium]
MYKYILSILFFVSNFWFNTSWSQLNKAKPSPSVKSKVVFFDDFSGKELNRKYWNVEVTGMHVNNELQAYIDSNATIQLVQAKGASNGALKLQPIYNPGFITQDGKKFDFVSGRINTNGKADFTYGKFEARIKLTEGDGLWPAWWMLGKENWPETGEIDIMEYVGETDWISAAVHGLGYSGDAGLVNRYYFPKNNDATQWHVYGVEWTEDSLVFKYDGITMFRVTKPMTNFFGKWAFNNPKYLILNYAVGGIYPFKVNGIQAPYYGLSEATLQKIKNKESYMLVDWVKVTQYQ